MVTLERRRRGPWGWTALAAGVVVIAVVVWLGAPHVVSATPLDGARDVSGLSPVRLTFNRPMDAGSVEGRLSFDPAVAGTYTWDGPSITFVPQSAWPEGAEVRVTLSPGARSTWYVPLLSEFSWSFHIAEPRLAYLAGAPGGAQLSVWNLLTGQGGLFSGAKAPVLDFDLSASAASVFYLTPSSAAGQTVHSLSLVNARDLALMACPAALCDQVSASPDGTWLALETSSSSTGGRGEVWVAPADDSQPARRLGPADHSLRGPLWSPAGRLAVYDDTNKSTLVLSGPPDFTQVTQLPNPLGAAAAWTPDGGAIIYPEIVFLGEAATPAAGQAASPGYFSHLYRHDIEGGGVVDLSGAEAELTEDASPAVSPDGQWIIFARRSLDAAHLTLGRQIWLMRSDGSQPRRLTSTPVMTYANFVWRPDSGAVAFVQSDMVDPTQPPALGWVNVSTGQVTLLPVKGYAPRWLP